MPEPEAIVPGTLKEGEIAVKKEDFDGLTAFKTSHTPPEKYEFKLPEGGRLSLAHSGKLAALGAKLGLSNESAAELVPFLETELGAHEEAYLTAHKPKGKEYERKVGLWKAESLADPELGNGDEAKLAANSELGRRVLAKFFDPKVAAFLDESGFGSHPELLKGFVKLGKLMKEADLVTGGVKKDERKADEEVFFDKK